ncbi:MAG: hypothetical protein ACKOZT_04625, partial [Cyanobium sp.]
ELVDGRGEPLNPPFNSVVREVMVGSGGSRPAWMNGRLSDSELAQLLGQASPITAVDVESHSEAQGTSAEALSTSAVQLPARSSPADAAREAGGVPAMAASAAADDDPLPSEAAAAQDAAATGHAIRGPEPVPPPGKEPPSPAPSEGAGQASTPKPVSQVQSQPVQNAPQLEPSTVQESPDAGKPESPAAPAAPPQPAPEPQSRPAARDEVNADGTLIRPSRPGPLQALRERLQR